MGAFAAFLGELVILMIVASNWTNSSSPRKGCIVGWNFYLFNTSFQMLSCMKCHCNDNSTITCRRPAIARPSGNQCKSHGSDCLANQTAPVLYKQFCVNCQTMSPSFKGGCRTCEDNYNKKYVYEQEVWKVNKCTICSCRRGGGIKCFYPAPKVAYLPRLRASCNNCNLKKFIRSYPCKKCKNFVTGQVYGSGSFWQINKCFICQCFAGRTYCRKEGTREPLCKSCVTYKLIKYMRKYQCKVCNDNHNDLIRLHKETFMLRRDVRCKCNDGRIQCKKLMEADLANRFRLMNISSFCDNCSAENIKQMQKLTVCTLMNTSISENRPKHVGPGESPYCFYCMCYFGETKCIYHVRDKHSRIIHNVCLTTKECSMLTEKMTMTCQRDLALNCQNYPPVGKSWMANGCNYSCNGSKLEFRMINRPWCQTISGFERCAICPDKKDFFKKYGSVFTSCKRFPEAIYRENICDGRYDCVDKSDENDCSSYYCQRYSQNLTDKTFLWQRSLVGTTKELPCEKIKDNWNGTVYRTCEFDPVFGTSWSNVSYCNCTDSQTDPFDVKGLSEMSLTDKVLVANQLVNFSRKSVNLKRSLELAVILINETLQEQFSNQTTNLKSLCKALMDLWTIKQGCQHPEERALKNTLRNKINVLRMSYNLTIKWFPKTVSYVKKWVSNYDDLFLPELLFGGEIQGIPVHENSQNVTGIRVVRNNSDPTNSTLKSQKVKQEPSKHVKIIFGLDAFLSMLSLCSLLVAVLVMFLISLPKTTKWFIRKNLFSAMTISLTIYIISLWAEHKMINFKWLCTFIVLANYYLSLAMYAWMGVEGINLVIRVVLVFQQKSKSHFKFAAFGWGFPLVILGTCFAVKPNAFLNTKGCISLGENSWLLKGPSAALIGMNSVLFVIIFMTLIKNLKTSRKLKSSMDRWRSSAKAFVTLVPLLGVTHILGFTLENGSVVMIYIYVFINNSMGLIFTIVHVFMDPQIREGLRNTRKRARELFQSNSDKYLNKGFSQSTTASTTTMVPASPSPPKKESFDTKF